MSVRKGASAYDRPPHGGYPTPRCEHAPARRRATSMRLFGHPGAAVSKEAESDMFWAGHGYRAGRFHWTVR